jgi:mannitol/fructose-specific phosphotransferase system IIA component (Ntr-type)
MDLNEFLGTNPSIIDLKSEDRWQAIDELIHHLVANNKIKREHQAAITASVRKRETSMTTGIGHGMGLPHASVDLITEVVAIVGCSRKGIQFDAMDGQPVNLVVLFLVPSAQFQKHLNTLANLAKILHDGGFRDQLGDRVP